MYKPKIYIKNHGYYSEIQYQRCKKLAQSCHFPSLLVGYCSIIIIKVNFLITSSNMSLHVCNGMVYNQHAHTHFSKFIRSE